MNLQTSIRAELWLAISNTYQAGNFSDAILDAMHHLSNVLREKTGVDGDGASLVGQALGGDSPRLRVNKLQTETEKNIQKGLEHILRGLYWAIRNPRSHEQTEDTKDTADAVIYFIDYLLGIIVHSEEPFISSKFLARVFDSDFVTSERYAELLVAEIPANKRTDTLIQIYRQKSEGDGEKLAYTVRAILKKLSDEQVAQFLDAVSEELKTTQDESTIRATLQMMPPKLWVGISEVSRLRIENKLIRSIQEGEIYPVDVEIKGALGTWARDFLKHFTLKDQIARVLLEKLEDDDSDDKHYVTKFFLVVLPEVVTYKWQAERCIGFICKAVRENDQDVRNDLVKFIGSLPDDWQKNFVDNLKDLTNPELPATYLPDGSPFLKLQEGEDLPF